MYSNTTILYLLMFCLILYFPNIEAQVLKTEGRENADTVLYIRRNAAGAEAAADLKAFEKAIGIMRSLPCDSPLSWYYQGAMHSVPDTVLNGNPLCPRFITMRDTLPGWNCCPHFGASEIHFLTWHRLFIWHFEKIIRKLSGKKDFAMPYWDYTNPKNRAIPAIFRDSSSPLFEPARFEDINRGKILLQCLNSSWNATIADTTRLYELFNHTINQGPHGPIHLVVGGWSCVKSQIKNMWNKIYQKNTTGLMWEFESSAFDPIFWVHHSNIDYLWHKWELSPNGALPLPESLKASPHSYTFFDENDGHKIVYSMEEVSEKINSLDYVYDVLANKTMHAVARSASPPLILASANISKAVNTSNFAFSMRVPAPLIRTANTNVPKAKMLFLLDVTVSFTRKPTGIYQLYLENAGKSLLVGHLTFVGSHHPGEKAMELMHGMRGKGGADEERLFKFDLSQKFSPASFNGNLKFRLLRKGGNAAEIKIKNVVLKTATL